MPRMIFVNLPVTDLKRATAFYEAVGAVRNPQFCDDTASCMVFSETIFAMLLTHDKFRQFTPKPIADAKTSNQVLLCLSADSRADVDAIVARAEAAGGVAAVLVDGALDQDLQLVAQVSREGALLDEDLAECPVLGEDPGVHGRHQDIPVDEVHLQGQDAEQKVPVGIGRRGLAVGHGWVLG